MTAANIVDTDATAQAREYGRRQGRGEIIAGLLARADQIDRLAERNPFAAIAEGHRATAAWLRDLADDIRQGRL